MSVNWWNDESREAIKERRRIHKKHENDILVETWRTKLRGTVTRKKKENWTEALVVQVNKEFHGGVTQM